jgi:hypothetical protein
MATECVSATVAATTEWTIRRVPWGRIDVLQGLHDGSIFVHKATVCTDGAHNGDEWTISRVPWGRIDVSTSDCNMAI